MLYMIYTADGTAGWKTLGDLIGRGANNELIL